MTHPLPLTLYIHLPWCVKKCPYCDFNSHRVPGEVPEAAYVEALMADLEGDLPLVWGRTVQAVFIGGGTPSLFSADHIDAMLSGIRQRLTIAPGAEITMEANPGAVEHDRFEAYRAAGVNRISLGVQSFDDSMLERLGRIHDGRESARAIELVRSAGFDNFNLDLMFALPGQSVDQALADIGKALEFAPPHISHYQLTLEPGTVFARHRPTLPDDESAWEMQIACGESLAAAGFGNYEISAWAQPGRACRHNLNYWRFGDYLGIGAGAHGKLSLPAENRVVRTVKQRQPRIYLNAGAGKAEFRSLFEEVAARDLAFEFFLNRFRLDAPIDLSELQRCTGVDPESVASALERAESLELIRVDNGTIHRTIHGARFLNDLQGLFLP